MTDGRGGWFTVRSVLGYFAVVLGVAMTLAAWLLPPAEASVGVEPAAGLEYAGNQGDSSVALGGGPAVGRVIRCGFSTRPIPPFDPGQTPELIEDAGPGLPADQDPEAVIPGLDACGAGVGWANLVFFWALCALGSAGLRRTRRP